jgi:alkanesulfonate monooxygenase SsuD/methylene tetrahydromethanopterin reductase-like flavin-dependent oxidoreductase (luciferase family)
MIGTLDVISGGRMELGIGAGWKEDEWRAYGYGFPDTKTRLATLSDHLEVITRMLGPGHATFAGTHASVTDAINVPRGLQQPRVPIMVGGNGPNVTWRLAARHADELNLDWLTPDEIRDAKPVIASRCEEIGRDPATLVLASTSATAGPRCGPAADSPGASPDGLTASSASRRAGRRRFERRHRSRRRRAAGLSLEPRGRGAAQSASIDPHRPDPVSLRHPGGPRDDDRACRSVNRGLAGLDPVPAALGP